MMDRHREEMLRAYSDKVREELKEAINQEKADAEA
jgi:hypothetical protein